MATNDFLPFAGGAGANVLTQAQYAALTSLLSSGFSAGTAQSIQVNKVWRQSSIMSAVLAQFIADQTGANSVDDGTTATLLGNLKSAIQPALGRTAHAGGTSDALTGVFNPVPTAYVDGLSYFVRAASANATTTPTFTPNSGVLAPVVIVKGAGTALVAGDIAGAGHWLELQYDSTLTKYVLLNPATGVTASVTGAQFQNQTYTAFTTAGTAPNFTLTPSPAIGSYAANQRFRVKFNASGTTGSNTLNISGLGAKNLKQYDNTGTKIAAVVAINQLADVEYDGTDMVVLDPLVSNRNDIVLIQHQLASGTASPTYTSGSWLQVALNTIVTDTGAIASLAANQFTLPAGSYEITGFVSASRSANSTSARIRLRNVTDAATTVQGVNGWSGSADSSIFAVNGQFTITASKTFEIDLYTATSMATTTSLASGDSEIYASIMLRRYS